VRGCTHLLARGCRQIRFRRRPPEEVPVRHRWSAALVVVLVLVVAGCADEKVDPAEARQERVERRLQGSFSDAQARCIVDRIDATVVRALDRTADLEPDSEAMQSYSDAVAACVADPDATTTTTSATTSSTDPATTAPG
jgi:hypothetical protein